MGKEAAEKVMNYLIVVVAVSVVLGLMLPKIKLYGVSLFGVISTIAAIALVYHIFTYTAPADRQARDEHDSKT